MIPKHSCHTHLCHAHSLDVEVVVGGLLAGEEGSLECGVGQVLYVPDEGASVWVGSVQLIQFVVQQQVSLLFIQPALHK